jgi:NAD-dependent deacetylase
VDRPSSNSESIDRIERVLSTARRVTVLTGAGVSAASGIPTFRGPGGLWRQQRPENLATPEAFARDPVLVWEWYDWRRQVVARALPNAAHHALARWSLAHPGVSIVTQNVDGLHERAGTRDVIRLHGSIWRLRCWNGCGVGQADWVDETVPLAAVPPTCPRCAGIARPAVVWFGESLDADVISAATDACQADVLFVVGTSAVVYPAASLAPIAKHCGAVVVEINPDETPASGVADISIRAGAETILPAINWPPDPPAIAPP